MACSNIMEIASDSLVIRASAWAHLKTVRFGACAYGENNTLCEVPASEPTNNKGVLEERS